jgi:hypothetical protein
MTSGADDALFGQDGTGPSVDGPAGFLHAETPAMAPADAEAVVRPVTAAPGWITGKPAPPWPPPDAASPLARPVSPARPALPVHRKAPGSPPTRPFPSPGPPPRPRVVEDPGILGLSRRARGRLGSRVFTWFFVLVFALIVVQMVASLVSIVDPW